MTGKRTETLLNSALHSQFSHEIINNFAWLKAGRFGKGDDDDAELCPAPQTFSPPHSAVAENGFFSILLKTKLLLWGYWPFIFKSNLPPTSGSAWNSISTSSERIDLRHWFLRCWIKAVRVRQIDPICRFVFQLLCYRNHFYIFQLLFSF